MDSSLRIGETTRAQIFLRLTPTRRDIAAANIMMDALTLYPEGYHPARRFVTSDARRQAIPLSRTDHPVQYYFIDFDLSVRFKEGESHDVIGDVGRDNEVPELSNDVPYNAFKVDIFALGNLYYKEFCKVNLTSSSVSRLMRLPSTEVSRYGVSSTNDRPNEASPTRYAANDRRGI